MVWIVVWRIFRGVIEIDYSFEPRAAMDRALASVRIRHPKPERLTTTNCRGHIRPAMKLRRAAGIYSKGNIMVRSLARATIPLKSGSLMT